MITGFGASLPSPYPMKALALLPKSNNPYFIDFETLAQYNILQPSSGIGLSLGTRINRITSRKYPSEKRSREVEVEFIVTLPNGTKKQFARLINKPNLIYPTSDNNSTDDTSY